MIPYGRQDIDQSDIDSVLKVLQSEFLTQGPQVPVFEKQVSDYCRAKNGIAFNSATSALHISCLALGLGKNDVLWTSPNSFVASANCGLYCGAKIDFVDIDPDTFNLCADKLKQKLVKAETVGALPKIVIVVHFAGQPCDMEKIYSLSKAYGFRIIEDASHAIGAEYLDRPIGNCGYSDITIFSFHPVKIITTAEGGLATTNNDQLAQAMRLLRSHGITRDPSLMTNIPHGDWYYEQTTLGFNYRMTELQAALGISQMRRLEQFVNIRHVLFKRYDDLLTNKGLTKPFQSPNSRAALHLYVIQVDKDVRKRVFDQLRASGIGVNVHYIPIHIQPFYQNLGFSEGECPVAESYYRRAISLPIFQGLNIDRQNEVIFIVNKIMSEL